MSRCFPYPPPGCERSPALIESIKLQKEREKAKKERKKEKKLEKEEKEKSGGDKEKSEGEKHSHRKRRYEELSRSTQETGNFTKTREDEFEQLERSSLTEEHEGPSAVQSLYDSSDSTQNSGKRTKHESAGVILRTTHRTGLRIRLPLSRHKDAELPISSNGPCVSGRTETVPAQQERKAGRAETVPPQQGATVHILIPPSTPAQQEHKAGRAVTVPAQQERNAGRVPPQQGPKATVLNRIPPSIPAQQEHKAGRQQERKAGRVPPQQGPKATVQIRIPPSIPAQQEHKAGRPVTTPAQQEPKVTVQHHTPSSVTAQQERKAGRVEPVPAPLGSKATVHLHAPSSLTVRRQRKVGRGEGVPPQQEPKATAHHHTASYDEQPCFSGRTGTAPAEELHAAAGPKAVSAEAGSFHISGDGSGCSRSSERDMRRLYKKLILEFNPPPLQAENPEPDDEDWLFGKGKTTSRRQQHHGEDETREERAAGEGSDLGSALCSWPPRACFLPEVGVHALPYVVPF